MQVPDFLNARISGEPAPEVIGDDEWLQTTFTNTVATRGGALIKKWGRSSAASTAVSIADAIKVRGPHLVCCNVNLSSIVTHMLYTSAAGVVLGMLDTSVVSCGVHHLTAKPIQPCLCTVGTGNSDSIFTNLPPSLDR